MSEMFSLCHKRKATLLRQKNMKVYAVLPCLALPCATRPQVLSVRDNALTELPGDIAQCAREKRDAHSTPPSLPFLLVAPSLLPSSHRAPRFPPMLWQPLIVREAKLPFELRLWAFV